MGAGRRDDPRLRPTPRGALLQRGPPPIEPVELDPEDEVLVAALARLPMERRLPLVLHYMAEVPTVLIAGWCRCTPAQVEALLDDGFGATTTTEEVETRRPRPSRRHGLP